MPKSSLISRLQRIDWDFAGEFSESRFSAIHWHPGRFVSQLPATFIGLFSSPTDVVLDPFAGSGTTLVEAQRLGRRSIGVDLNPVACTLVKSKTLRISASQIQFLATEIKKDAHDCLAIRLQGLRHFKLTPLIPATVQSGKWYSKKVQKALGLLWGILRSYSGPSRVLAECAFSSILLPVCRETRHWGYVCDNSTPKTDHEGDVLREFCVTLDFLAAAYRERDADIRARFGENHVIEEAAVHCKDVKDFLRELPSGSVDLVVTSPPYFGVSDYVKAQRLSMEWFGYEIEPLRLREIGARSKRHRQTAWHEYVNDLAATLSLLRESLRKGGTCIVIVGESATRESVMQAIREMVSSTGLKLEIELNRTVSSQRRQAPSVKAEHLFVLSR